MFLKIKNATKKVLDFTDNIMFPSNYCPICQNESLNGEVCNNCAKYLIKPNFCKVCGEHVSAESDLCIECKDYNRYFTQSRSCFLYNGDTSAPIIKLKDKGAKYLAKDFAKLLYNVYVSSGFSADIVCSVPTTTHKIKKRGYNHSAEIAKEFCVLSGLSYADILVKTKDTAEQKSLSRKDRLKNLIGSFAVTDKWLVKNRNILLIDDVFTTGSTLSACSKALKDAKSKNIYCLTVAKSPIKD